MEDNKTQGNEIQFADNVPDLLPPEVAAQLTPDLGEGPTEADIAKLQSLISGLPQGKKVRPQRFWYNGQLISREEHDKLSVDEVRAWNDIVSFRSNK